MNYKKLLFIALIALSANIAPLFCGKINLNELKKKEHLDKKNQTIYWEFLDKSNLAAQSKYTINKNKTATLNIMHISSEYRKKGLGSALFKEIMQEIITKYPTIKEVTWLCMPLDKETDFDKLCDFYRKFGTDIDVQGFAALDLEYYQQLQNRNK